MANRRRRQRPFADHSDRPAPNNMDHLTFKYMEMCKVESSTDSDSEISPRWSDTSTMGCVSSAAESGTSRRIIHKPAVKHGCYSSFLDPYDGSSEDTDESDICFGVSSRHIRQQAKCVGAGCRLSRGRRFILHHPAPVALRDVVKHGKRSEMEQQHLLDVQMKCGSDSELDTLSSHCCRNPTSETVAGHPQTMDVEFQLDDSGLHATRSSTPGPQTPVDRSSSEKSPSPCHLTSLYKRKLGLPGADVVELGQRKRQCVVNMEDE
ncbi:uncharacterized protein LOC114427946 [Parambassis ranga]|uniref:Uncharacterized protein LOC114427946 n=1 Tax=Parambassis ranga TaxID=210632 RepID=A0A6P7HTR3_9TELE|nr:uncharacterized protein LOC114427946 [Parambassis ranga]